MALTCARCGRALTGSYITALGQPWHADCFVCAGCGRAIGAAPFVAHEARPYHPECYQEQMAPRCDVCGAPLPARFYRDRWGSAYCPHHRDELPECYSCGRLICEQLTGGGVRYPDGRPLCALCRRTAIDDVPAGLAVLAEVRRALAGQGFDLGPLAIAVRLVGQDELAQMAPPRETRLPAGMARVRALTADGREVQRDVQDLLVLHGLPREHFAAVVAHELGHVWLFLHGLSPLEPLVEEGLCELCVLLWLKGRTAPEAAWRLALMEANADPVYGEGFRRARAGYERMGLAGLLKFVRERGKLPVGA